MSAEEKLLRALVTIIDRYRAGEISPEGYNFIYCLLERKRNEAILRAL